MKGGLLGNKLLVGFEVEEGWSTRAVKEGYGVGLWKDIRKEGFLMSNQIGFSVGSGRSEVLEE